MMQGSGYPLARPSPCRFQSQSVTAAALALVVWALEIS
jgi:hypothetical protein